MGKLGIAKSMVAILLLSLLFPACDSDTANFTGNREKLNEIANLLEVEFPANAKIVHTTKSDRNNELSYRYIIYSIEPVEFKVAPSSKAPAEDAIDILNKFDVIKKPGALKDKWAYRYEGTVKNGEWRAYQTNFENCSYLDIEQFYF